MCSDDDVMMTSYVYQGNDLLRDIFQLGPVPAITVDSKASRLEKVHTLLPLHVGLVCQPILTVVIRGP